jgi:DNA repair protein RadD
MSQRRGGETPEFSEEGRRACIVALNQRLRPADLRRLVPTELTRLVAKVERRDGLYDPRIADDQLATFVIDLHGPELLRDRDVRRLLAQRASDDELEELYRLAGEPRPARGRSGREDQVVLKRWHAGKSWPRHFVRTLGLPPALAGTSDGGEEPAYEDVEPYVPLPPLHEFQATLLQEVLAVLRGPAGQNRAILSLPTGAGKTRTMVEAIVEGLMHRLLPGRFLLWIAQSDELCEQALQAFRQVWTDRCVRSALLDESQWPDPLRLFRLWSSRPTPEPSETGGVVIASIQKLDALCRTMDEQVAALLEAIGVVIVDEAHHAIAPSYLHVFRALGLGGRKEESERPMVGLTATPYRGTSEETGQLIRRFFGCLLTPPWPDPIPRLRQEGILAQMTPHRIATGCRFSLDAKERQYLGTFHDLPDSALGRIGSDERRNALILEELLRFPSEEWPVLFFGCSVTHARAVALLLRRAGRSAAAVTGETPRSLRRNWINDFKTGQLQFLCNFGVLTTGFDAPKVQVVVVARPTASVLLYEQMIGRGMRGPANGGTEECLVMDMIDVIPQFGEAMSYQRYADLWTRRRPQAGAVRSDG